MPVGSTGSAPITRLFDSSTDQRKNMNQQFVELASRQVTDASALMRPETNFAGAALAACLLMVQPVLAASFRSTGPMNTPRSYHTATLLADGKVLVAGGHNGTQQIATAELYLPGIGTWTTTGLMGFARAGHTATRLPGGKVLVAGGYDGTDLLSSAEVYDPAAGIWASTGSMITSRSAHTATLLPNGQVLVSGGVDGSGASQSAELYDPLTGTWSSTGSMNYGRYNHTATLLPNGLVLAADGEEGGAGYTAELFDPSSGTWALTGELIDGRTMHTATLLPNGRVLAAGGAYFSVFFSDYLSLASAEQYDPGSGLWSNTGSMVSQGGVFGPLGHFAHTATLLPNGQVLLAGGRYGFVAFLAYTSFSVRTAELYDPISETWTATGMLIQPRQRHTATLLPDGEVLIAGGFRDDPDDALASAERYGVVPTPTILTSPVTLDDGSFQFSFTNAPGAILSVVATTDLGLPLVEWNALGGVAEISPGQFQFTDTQATNHVQRFYRTLSP